jgi:hypothetical protein
MMRHRGNEEVLIEVEDEGRTVVGGHVYSSFLGASLFVQRLGKSNVEVLRHGYDEYVPVLKQPS